VTDPDRLAGVRIRELIARSDDRGSFTEIFRPEWLPGTQPIAQSNLSRSHAGVLRGMHFHRRQADYWCFTRGHVWVALFDLRAGSPTERRPQTLELDAPREMIGLYVPPGVAHGFYAHTEATLLYLVDRGFDGTDEFGFAWNDPDLPVTWPAGNPVVSERDRTAPPLSEALSDPPEWVDLPAAGA
jgi:dTDP-4-dehydrorhamnose 3,5-epimerase